MERDEILDLCHSNSEVIVSYIGDLESRYSDLESRYNELESQNVELRARIDELESRLNQNIQTRNKPPSTGFHVEKGSRLSSSRETSGKRAGGQKGHPGSTLKMSESPDEIITNRLCNCIYCGHSIEEIEVIGHEKRQKYDITMNRKVTEYRSEIKKCPYCNRKSKADFPESVTKPVQLGNTVLTIATYLRDYHLIPYQRIKEIMRDIFGLGISPASIKKAETKCFHNLKGATNYIKNKLIKEDVINCDETGIDVNGRVHYCHVTSTEKLTFYFHDRSRGSRAMKKMKVLPRFRGIAVHDFWKPYFKYKNCEHAVCNVHILRELKEISKNKTQKWSLEMSDLLREIKKCVDGVKKLGNKIEEETIKAFKEKYDSILMKGFEDNPPQNLEFHKGKRGMQAQSDAKNLLDRLSKYKTEVLRFVTDLRVPFGNNQAERDIRMITIQQKISGSFRTPHGADAFCRIRGYISTIMKNNMPILSSLNAVFEGVPPLP
ncbi:MAG: IS66 family transposase [Methanobacterium sp.]